MEPWDANIKKMLRSERALHLLLSPFNLVPFHQSLTSRSWHGAISLMRCAYSARYFTAYFVPRVAFHARWGRNATLGFYERGPSALRRSAASPGDFQSVSCLWRTVVAFTSTLPVSFGGLPLRRGWRRGLSKRDTCSGKRRSHDIDLRGLLAGADRRP